MRLELTREMFCIRLGAWSLGRVGQLGSVATGNSLMVPPMEDLVQALSQCTFAQK
jgi:hypothetical protein